METDETTVTTTTRVVRPFKIIAIVLVGICFGVMVAVLANKMWITATGFNQGLWQECYNGTRIVTVTVSPLDPQPTMQCYAAQSSSWLIACQALVILTLVLTLVSFVLAVIALCKGKRFANFYKIAGVLLFISGVFMIVTLALFPIMSIKEPVVTGRQNWELAWGYGLGWGSFLLMVAAGILFLFAPDKQEIYYSEKTNYYQ